MDMLIPPPHVCSTGHLHGRSSEQGARTELLVGWRRKTRESVLETDKTRISQDPVGGSLVIDTLPDNETQIVVSWRGVYTKLLPPPKSIGVVLAFA